MRYLDGAFNFDALAASGGVFLRRFESGSACAPRRLRNRWGRSPRRTTDFVGIRALTDLDLLQRRVSGLDVELFAPLSRRVRGDLRGDPHAGPVALAPPSGRFHWLTAPRSDVLQSSPVHEGLYYYPAAALDDLFADLVVD